jgi:hypothetical protein
MLKSIFEVEAINQPINGVDSPNLMSVDSTTPIITSSDEVNEEDERLEHPEIIKEKAEAKKKKEEEEKKKKEEEEVTEEVEETEEAKTEREAKEKLEKEKAEKVPESVQKRIDKAVKNQRVAERERDFFKNKVQELEAENLKLKSNVPATDKPKRADFESDEDFTEALTDWKIDQKLKTKQEETDKGKKTAEELRAETELQETIVSLVERGKVKYEDWDETAGNTDLKITPELLGIIIESDASEDIMHYLGLNPDLASEISAMSAKKAAIEVGKIEVALAEEPENVSQDVTTDEDTEEEKEKAKPKPVVKQIKKVSSAPPPIKPVKTLGVVEKDPNQMTSKEYRVWREGQKK